MIILRQKEFSGRRRKTGSSTNTETFFTPVGNRAKKKAYESNEGKSITAPKKVLDWETSTMYKVPANDLAEVEIGLSKAGASNSMLGRLHGESVKAGWPTYWPSEEAVPENLPTSTKDEINRKKYRTNEQQKRQVSDRNIKTVDQAINKRGQSEKGAVGYETYKRPTAYEKSNPKWLEKFKEKQRTAREKVRKANIEANKEIFYNKAKKTKYAKKLFKNLKK